MLPASTHSTADERQLSIELMVNRRAVVRTLWTVIALLLLADTGLQLFERWTGHNDVYGLATRFDLDLEQTFPAFFSACQHLAAAILLYAIGRADSNQARLTHYWFGLAVVFLFLAVDEAVGVHEMLERPTRELLDWLRVAHPPFAWVITATIGLAVAAPVVRRFLATLEAQTRWRFLVAGAVFLAGAVVVEVPEGYQWASHRDGLVHRALIATEEVCEMAGMTLFIDALLRHLVTRTERLTLHLKA